VCGLSAGEGGCLAGILLVDAQGKRDSPRVRWRDMRSTPYMSSSHINGACRSNPSYPRVITSVHIQIPIYLFRDSLVGAHTVDELIFKRFFECPPPTCSELTAAGLELRPPSLRPQINLAWSPFLTYQALRSEL
jgi:hypothetical protein